MAKYSREDVQYLAQCINRTKAIGVKPFAFLLGAGMSVSAGIPLARELVTKIYAEPEFSMHLRGLSDAEKTSYQKCMEKLSKGDRRRLLDPFLRQARVNWASLSVAALMKHEFVSRVLTFNFDSVLARACGISGHYPATYDFSVDPPEDFNFIREGAIIHLHGQGAGLVMLNSERETRDHAKKLQHLFANTLESYNLVVIGYSGEADHSFEKLSEKFNGSNRLFWIGHNDDVPLHVRELIDRYPDTSFYWGGADADLFLIELAQQFECWPPVMFTDPDQHLLEEIGPVIDYPASLAGKNILRSLREKLERQRAERRLSPLDFQSLLLEGRYGDIIDRADEADDPRKKDAVAWAYIMQGNELFDLAETKRDVAVLRESFEKYATAVKINPESHEAFNNWGNALAVLARKRQDESLYRESFEKYAEAVNIKPEDHEASNNWGNALAELARIKQDELLYRQSFEKYSEAVKSKPDNHEAFNNWGNALAELARIKQDESLYRQSFEKYSEAVKIKSDKDETFSNWGAALAELARIRQDESLYSQSFEKYAEAVKIKPDKHEAFNKWGAALVDLATMKQDESLFSQSFEKFAKAVKIKPDKYDAINNWGSALLTLAEIRRDESLFRESFEKYAEAVQIEPDKYEAFCCWGTALAKLADMRQDENLFRESFEKFSQAVRIKPDSHEAFHGWGSALANLAEMRQDESLFRESFEKYAEAVKVSPDKCATLNTWGTALLRLAEIRRDESLFRESFEKYAEVVKIKPDHHDAYYNWGTALAELAEIRRDESLFRESFGKYAEAVKIKPNDSEAYHNWAIALIQAYHCFGERGLLDEALAKAERSQWLSGRANYIVACAYALLEREEDCRRQLYMCRDARALPKRQHLLNDPYLVAYRARPWFKVLLASLG